MSNGQEEVSAQPLVIVRRRRGGEEGGHHGGVWKIAYADFMTAMMAFFLVMWLINAADKKTIIQVAAYFNPLRLTDRTASQKGLNDLDEAAPNKAGKKDTKKKDQDKENSKVAKPIEAMPEELATKTNDGAVSGVSPAKEEAIFSDPMSVLEKLAAEAKVQNASASPSEVNSDVVRDPFDPAHRSVAPQVTAPPSKPPVPQPPQQKTHQKPKPDTPAVESKETLDARRQEDAKIVENELKAALSKFSAKVPGIEVKATPDGLLVSILDDADFGMFAVGSAEPQPQLVLMMEKVAGVLRPMNGRIVVRGHTDGRAYKKGGYDNWRLSSARAQMAYYMLVRGGIDEKSFVAIEGRADRDLKVPQDNAAAQNRRIDILIKDKQP